MLQTQPLEIEDFSGGITDNYIDCALNQYKEGDNFFITRNKKLFTRYGSSLLDLAAPQLPEGQHRVGALISFEDELLAQARDSFYAKTLSGWGHLVGPTGNPFLAAGDNFKYVAHTTWNSQLLVTSDLYVKATRLYKDQTGTLQVRTAGLPKLQANPTIVGTAGANNYVYAFIRSYNYMVGDVEFQEVSDVVYIELENANAPDVNQVDISNIPLLSNVGGLNYDITNVKVEIYRTENAGVTFYKVAEVTNGTTDFSDTTPDSSLLTSPTLYTNGGLLGYEEPPLAKYVHVVADVGYYGNIKEGTQILADRVLLSIPGAPAAVPRLFFLEFGQEVTGLSSAEDVPLVFCKNSVYRIDGTFDSLGKGNPTPQRLSSTVGCVSNRSIVKVSGGVFFAGQDGFYFTDGFNVKKVSREINKRYSLLVENSTQAARIYGTYDSREQRVWWAVSTNAGLSEDNDKMFILDLNFGVSDNMPFTTATNGNSFAPSSLVFYQNNLIRGDKRGFVFKHEEGQKSDPKIDLLTAPTEWTKDTIIWTYEGFATSFETNFMRKWVTRISMLAANESNVNVQVTSINDDYKAVADLSLIRFEGQLTWGDPDIVWGDPNIIWNGQGMLSEIRHFPKNNLRCSLKQVKISNGFGVVTNSDLVGTAVVNALAKHAVLSLPQSSWPFYSVDYVIAFENDGYVNEFPITIRNDDSTITLSDIGNLLPSGTQKWVIRGYAKNEVLNLLSYTLHYAVLGQTQKTFDASSTGENA
jgi:hypothetical protein